MLINFYAFPLTLHSRSFRKTILETFKTEYVRTLFLHFLFAEGLDKFQEFRPNSKELSKIILESPQSPYATYATLYLKVREFENTMRDLTLSEKEANSKLISIGKTLEVYAKNNSLGAFSDIAKQYVAHAKGLAKDFEVVEVMLNEIVKQQCLPDTSRPNRMLREVRRLREADKKK